MVEMWSNDDAIESSFFGSMIRSNLNVHHFESALHYSNKSMPAAYDNDESESSESSFDSVDSLYSDCSESSRKSSGSSYLHSYKKPVMPLRNLYLALDCEMVNTVAGPEVARVVLVDWKSRSVLDTHVKPQHKVTDYLTFVSGVTEEDLVDAPSFSQVQAQVRELLTDKILVGHGLENDLSALQLEHPWWMIRDTAYYQPFMQLRDNMYVPRKLKDLCQQKLNKTIQVLGSSHCPFEDAKAALDLYKSHRPRWETCVTSQVNHQAKMVHRQQQQQQRRYDY